jgi:hypothetical protein
VVAIALCWSGPLDGAQTVIWSACGFESPEQAADLYHSAYPQLEHAAYPQLERDEYLVDEIRAIGERGSKSLGHPIR